jgi:heme exporter protein D
MDGLSRWDLVIWIVVAYVAVMVLVRLMLQHRDAVFRNVRDQLTTQHRSKSRPTTAEKRQDAA